MPYKSAFVVLVMLGGLSVSPPLQAPPVDLSGAWVVDADVKGRPSPFCGRGCEITQDAKALTVTSPAFPTATYQLDGVPVKTTSISGQYKADISVTARWDNDRLLITRKTGELPASELVVSMQNGKMTVEPAPNQGNLLGAPVKATYSRKPKSAATK